MCPYETFRNRKLDATKPLRNVLDLKKVFLSSGSFYKKMFDLGWKRERGSWDLFFQIRVKPTRKPDSGAICSRRKGGWDFFLG